MTHNHFDNIQLDICRVNDAVLANKKHTRSRLMFPTLTLILNALIVKSKVSREFVYSYILTGWFKNFTVFWLEILQGRPIDILDFHFLRQIYRVKFQSVEHADEASNEEFLKAWNRNENVYLLFAGVWKYAKTAYLDFLPYLFCLPRRGKILEYGCGMAPFTTGMRKYFPHRKYSFEIADIAQINFLYGIFMNEGAANVSYRFLEPHDNLVKDKGYSVIICQTVFEHVPNPLNVVKSFYDGLGEGGVLVFDYIKSEGNGLDSKRSVIEREATLHFIHDHFDIVKGHINANKNVALCVAKKITNKT